MIISNNKKPPLYEFEKLIKRTVHDLNYDAKIKSNYFKTRNGTALETDIYETILKNAKNTVFDGTIELISNQYFPDIIAAKYYGVEVKSTKSNHWTSTGSSIIESTRIEDVERIFLIFGKLSDPVEFRAKPYEECLSDIVVTHSPRYKIDMTLVRGDTIFDKMDTTYDEFRSNEDSISLVKNYYKKHLKSGQRLWWLDNSDIEEQSVSPIVRMWNTLDSEEKKSIIAQSFVWFPEIFSNKSDKFQRLALWLVTQHGIVSTSLRDNFSAGGKVNISTNFNTYKNIPRIFKKVLDLKHEIVYELLKADETNLKEYWMINEEIEPENRIFKWLELVIINFGKDKEKIRQMLLELFDKH